MLLDSGDTFIKKKSSDELRAEAILSGMDLMKYDAINVSDGELSLGKNFFIHLAGKVDIPFISANLTGLSDVMPYIVRKFGDFKVAITGITADVFFDEDAMAKDSLSITSHIEALKKVLPEMREKSDIVILLSHLDYQGTLNLFRFNNITGVDVAIAGHGRKLLEEPQEINGTLIVQNSMGGEFLGVLKLETADGVITDYSGEVIALTDDMPGNEKALAIMEQFKVDKAKLKKNTAEKKKERELKKMQTKYLKMSPQEFLDMMKKENVKAAESGLPAKVPMK